MTDDESLEPEASASDESVPEKRYAGKLVLLGFGVSLVVTTLLALVIGGVSGQPIYLLVVPVFLTLVSFAGMTTRTSLRWRSIWMGACIGAPVAVLVSGATCVGLSLAILQATS